MTPWSLFCYIVMAILGGAIGTAVGGALLLVVWGLLNRAAGK